MDELSAEQSELCGSALFRHKYFVEKSCSLPEVPSVWPYQGKEQTCWFPSSSETQTALTPLHRQLSNRLCCVTTEGFTSSEENIPSLVSDVKLEINSKSTCTQNWRPCVHVRCLPSIKEGNKRGKCVLMELFFPLRKSFKAFSGAPSAVMSCSSFLCIQ